MLWRMILVEMYGKCKNRRTHFTADKCIHLSGEARSIAHQRQSEMSRDIKNNLQYPKVSVDKRVPHFFCMSSAIHMKVN